MGTTRDDIKDKEWLTFSEESDVMGQFFAAYLQTPGTRRMVMWASKEQYDYMVKILPKVDENFTVRAESLDHAKSLVETYWRMGML